MARKISVEIVGDSRNLERAFGRASKAGSTFGSKMRTLGKVAAAGVAGGFVAFGLALRAGFKELAQAQVVAAQTRAVLMSTGGVANVTATQVEKLATSISRKSGIDDEAIMSAENLLLTFTNIRNEAGKGNNIFDRTTQATADMATALGMDLPSAAMMVGKAMNQMDVTSQGNVRGFMALRRIGVQISPAMMAQAAAFIKANKPMEAQKLLLRELNTEFGGSAAAFGTTMPGALGKMRNAFDELMAAFATGFLPIVLKVSNALTKKLADPAFIARVRAFGELVGTKLYNAFVAVGTWFDTHWPGIRQGFVAVRNFAQRVHGWLSKIASVTPGGAGTLVGMIMGGILLSKLRGLAAIAFLLLRRLRGAAALSAADLAAGKTLAGGKGKTGAGKGALFGALGGPPGLVAAAVLSAGGASGARTGAYQPGMFKFVDALLSRMQAGGKLRAPEKRLLGGFGNRSISELSGSQLNWLNNRLGDIVVNIDGREVARVTLPHLQRKAKTGSTSRRGHFAGASLGLGSG